MPTHPTEESRVPKHEVPNKKGFAQDESCIAGPVRVQVQVRGSADIAQP